MDEREFRLLGACLAAYQCLRALAEATPRGVEAILRDLRGPASVLRQLEAAVAADGWTVADLLGEG